jgi:hypothetical protein
MQHCNEFISATKSASQNYNSSNATEKILPTRDSPKQEADLIENVIENLKDIRIDSYQNMNEDMNIVQNSRQESEPNQHHSIQDLVSKMNTLNALCGSEE